MLHRPSRLVYVRDGDVVTKSKRSKSESALLLTTEFNYQYRVHDPVWLSYKEPGDDAPKKETPGHHLQVHLTTRPLCVVACACLLVLDDTSCTL